MNFENVKLEDIVIENLSFEEIIELETNFKLEPIEYGVYINKTNRFNELKELIKEEK